MWPSVQIQDFQSKACIPLSALCSPQNVLHVWFSSFSTTVFTDVLSASIWKYMGCPLKRTTFVPHCRFFLLCHFQPPCPDLPSPPISWTPSSTVSFLTFDILVSMVMLSHVITFMFLYLVYSQSPYNLASLSPGLFPSLLLTDCFSVVCVTSALRAGHVPSLTTTATALVDSFMPFSPITLSNCRHHQK